MSSFFLKKEDINQVIRAILTILRKYVKNMQKLPLTKRGVYLAITGACLVTYTYLHVYNVDLTFRFNDRSVGSKINKTDITMANFIIVGTEGNVSWPTKMLTEKQQKVTERTDPFLIIK